MGSSLTPRLMPEGASTLAQSSVALQVDRLEAAAQVDAPPRSVISSKRSLVRSRSKPSGHLKEVARGSKGEDLETRLTLTLDELYHGGSKKIAIDLEGRGTPSELTIKIPPGTKDGMKIRLTGKGRPSRVGGPAGDLLLSVEVRPQAEASVDEFDITLPLKLAPWEAALGGKVEFATIDGSVMLSVPAGVSSGQKMRLKGKGIAEGRRVARASVCGNSNCDSKDTLGR